MKTLRILFTAICAVCIAAFVPVGTIFGWGFAAICAAAAFCSFAFMLVCKQAQTNDEKRKNSGENDFFSQNAQNQNDFDANNGNNP